MRARTVAAAALALFGTGLLVACSVLTPMPPVTRLEGRLQAFSTAGMPLERPVTIHWDDHQIPFVVAETDGDGAFAFGLVHAHLRLGQMGVVRRIVQGRLSESAGPLTVDLDHAIRSLDVYRAADDILAAMPPATRAWMDRYVAGVNHGAAHQIALQPPHEFRVLAIDWEPWTAQDSIALGRASGIDLNWDFLLRILSIPDADLRDRLAVRILQGDPGGAQAVAALPEATAFAERPVLTEFAELAALAGRSGSNSMVVGPERSATGAALIASDPHLAFIFPNAWIVAGLRSPSYNLVGMMVPGTPVFAFGRNERLAWGGTNLRARTSQLVDVSALDPALISETRHRIGVRLLPDARRVTRQTPYGPILSDLDLLSETGGTFAVRWTGHTVTDETTALLNAMRARSVPEFQAAVSGFAFPPLTFLAADNAGNVGAITAARVPARAPDQGFDIITSPAQSDQDWRRLWDGRDLPHGMNPSEGFIASANNRPAPDGQRPYGGVFLQDERIRRLNALLARLPQASLRDLAEIQLDVVSPVAVEFLASVADDLRTLPLQALPERQARDALLAWDGTYHAETQAPAIFESFLTALVPLTYDALGRGDEWETYAALGRLPLFLTEDLALLPNETRAQVMTRALRPAAIVATDGTRWGDLHRLRVTHVLGNLPIIGRRYDIATLPISGSRETILKTAHDLTDQPHLTMFGAQARHLSDLGDIDENHFVLLGGQDGWINSTTFADQVAPFMGGDLIRVPLRPSSISTAFEQRIHLLPDR